MNSYGDFAYIYDRLMYRDINYEAWADYIENIFTELDINPDTICDLACGTGNISIPLARRGYRVVGADASADMLSAAMLKENKGSVTFIKRDMARLTLPCRFDAFTCMIDGLNYLISPKTAAELFKQIKNKYLRPGGVFIFDISSEYKLSKIIGDNTFIHSEYDIFYSWQNRYIKSKRLLDLFLTFFVRDGSCYRRFEERQLQRAYTEREMRGMLKAAGFDKVLTYDELTFDKPDEKTERIVFVCR